MCVHESKFCNGVNDCTDSTDELFCNIECDADKEFKCHSPPYCIFKKWQCDGERDCSDGSDEKNCTKSICPKGEFSCKNSDSSSERTGVSFSIKEVFLRTQCPRTDLSKRFLPKPMTTTG